MKIVVGLGNPGKKYENSRHNLGYMVINKLSSRLKAQGLRLKNEKKFKAEVGEVVIEGEKILLVKPATFMNSSGKTLRLLITNYKLPMSNLIVIHDDVDLPFGKIKVQKGKGAAGHKGVESIIAELKTKDFLRIRIGVGRNGDIEKYVLSPFSKEERKSLENVFQEACERIFALL